MQLGAGLICKRYKIMYAMPQLKYIWKILHKKLGFM